jgi:ribosomal protein L23
VFEVAAGATKIDIKRAVEKLLGSKVEAVRTSIAHGKFKRQGASSASARTGRRPT